VGDGYKGSRADELYIIEAGRSWHWRNARYNNIRNARLKAAHMTGKAKS